MHHAEVATEQSAPNAELTAIGEVITQIRRVVLVIALCIWTVVGFLFWIPMLVFAIISFSALVACATIVDVDPSRLSNRLEHAIRFYIEGFSNVVKALYVQHDSVLQASVSIELGRVVLHVLATITFWAVIVLMLACWGLVGILALWISAGIVAFCSLCFVVVWLIRLTTSSEGASSGRAE